LRPVDRKASSFFLLLFSYIYCMGTVYIYTMRERFQ
jgi:hypothetical protein